MKLALLLPGYLESPDYRHLVVIGQSLESRGYSVLRVDPCRLWETKDVSTYTTSNYILQVKQIIESYLPQKPEEIVLVGHSLGCLVALLVGNQYSEVTKLVCLSCPTTLNNSDHKWVNGFRVTKKDTPADPTQFVEFTVPFSFAQERSKYSITDAFTTNHKPVFTIMGSLDPSTLELEKMVKDLPSLTFKIIDGMAHDFRQSEELCQQVAGEIDGFLATQTL